MAVGVLCKAKLPFCAAARPTSETDALLPPARISHSKQGVTKLVSVQAIVPRLRAGGEPRVPPVAGFAHFHLVVEVKTLKAGAGVRSAHVDMKAVWARLSPFASLTGEDRVPLCFPHRRGQGEGRRICKPPCSDGRDAQNHPTVRAQGVAA